MPACPRLGNAGFGLIEVAVALLVLAIGALGLASLQIAAKRVGYEAIQRTEAAWLATDLFERMRANRAALGHYSTAGLGAATGLQLPTPGLDCQRARCTAAQLSAWDLWQWERALDGAAVSGSAGGLVRPTACVTVSGRRVLVEIAWEGFRGPGFVDSSSDCGAGAYGPGDAVRQLLQISSYIGAHW